MIENVMKLFNWRHTELKIVYVGSQRRIRVCLGMLHSSSNSNSNYSLDHC